MKSPILAAYRAIIQDLMKHFTFIECKVINRKENKLADSLATLATKFVLKKEKNDPQGGETTWPDQR